MVSSFSQSFCGLLEIPGNLATPQRPLTKSVVLRDSAGWRSQWIIEGLTPSTNYTVYVINNATSVSPPLYFSTKSCELSPRQSSFALTKLNIFFFKSTIRLLSRSLPSLLPRSGLLRPLTASSIPTHNLYTYQLAVQYLRSADLLPGKLHYHYSHICLRKRRVFPSPKLCVMPTCLS